MARNLIQVVLLAGIRRWAPETPKWDRLYALLYFHKCHGRWPSRRRLLINDYLYFLKTCEEIDNPLRTFVTDKEHVKEFVRARLGEESCVPTYFVLRRPEELTEAAFPAQCVIKPTHSYNEVILRQSGEPVNMKRIASWFSSDHYRKARQRNYRGLKPKIIVEPFVFNDPNAVDYKIFCFRGEPKVIDVIAARRTTMVTACYSLDWKMLPYAMETPLSRRVALPRPDNLEQMIEGASVLSREFTFMRVDMYSNGSSFCVGELTSVPGNAASRFIPRSGEAAFYALMFGEVKGDDPVGRALSAEGSRGS
jgi:hypothetical protein